jgi:hypothetical protein
VACLPRLALTHSLPVRVRMRLALTHSLTDRTSSHWWEAQSVLTMHTRYSFLSLRTNMPPSLSIDSLRSSNTEALNQHEPVPQVALQQLRRHSAGLDSRRKN